jgi:hypothetical protein
LGAAYGSIAGNRKFDPEVDRTNHKLKVKFISNPVLTFGFNLTPISGLKLPTTESQ